MTRKEIVKRAVEMNGPSRLPIYYFNKDQDKSDMMTYHYKETGNPQSFAEGYSEWGFKWERLDNTMGQPKDPPVAQWSMAQGYRVPDPDAPGRFHDIQPFIAKYKDRYLMGGLGISGFNRVTFIRGFENTLEDFFLERSSIEQLIGQVFSFEEAIIRKYGEFGMDAVAFGDDWGTQRSLMISPEMWRALFLHRYKKQFDLVHEYGMHVYFHSCGYINDIIPDLIAIGADILNLNQPDIFGIERLGNDYGGKVCFNCPVDHQTTAVQGTRDEIFRYVRRLCEHLGCFNGGYIGYIEEYGSIGMSSENYRHICDAFESVNL